MAGHLVRMSFMLLIGAALLVSQLAHTAPAGTQGATHWPIS